MPRFYFFKDIHKAYQKQTKSLNIFLGTTTAASFYVFAASAYGKDTLFNDLRQKLQQRLELSQEINISQRMANVTVMPHILSAFAQETVDTTNRQFNEDNRKELDDFVDQYKEQLQKFESLSAIYHDIKNINVVLDEVNSHLTDKQLNALKKSIKHMAEKSALTHDAVQWNIDNIANEYDVSESFYEQGEYSGCVLHLLKAMTNIAETPGVIYSNKYNNYSTEQLSHAEDVSDFIDNTAVMAHIVAKNRRLQLQDKPGLKK